MSDTGAEGPTTQEENDMTTNAWDQAAGMAAQHSNTGGLFVRLGSNGDTVVGAFCGEPLPREVVWNGERYEPYDSGLYPDKRPSLRIALNFYVPAEGAMKIIEGGKPWFQDVLKVRAKYGLDTWLFEIERHGEAGDPKTTYSILPEERIDDAMRAKIREAGLHNLEALLIGGPAVDDAQPLDADTVATLVARLKALPRAEVGTFLAQLQVERVRDLKRSHLDAAEKLIGALEARNRGAAEVDPFL